MVATELGLKDETKGWIFLEEIKKKKSTTVNSLEGAREGWPRLELLSHGTKTWDDRGARLEGAVGQ